VVSIHPESEAMNPVRYLSCTLALSIGVAGSAAFGADGFLDQWFATSDAAKEAQPHWMTPVVTVTPRLEQEYRYDQSWQTRPKSVELANEGGGKGLELIPSADTELIIGEPAYTIRQTPKGTVTGWADETVLLKYRALSANEEHGNYMVTGFLGLSFPTGGVSVSNHTTLITPTLAAGRGWGTRMAGFDVQSTLGISIPAKFTRTLGAPVVWNTAFQGHLLDKLWPEIEVNYTYYDQGPNNGRTQLALTAGLVLGRFELSRHARAIIGAGYQRTVGGFYTFNHTWLLTARLAF
jgi:hypothetical protein